MVRDYLLPNIQAEFGEARTDQEDWGWFIWLKRGRSCLGVDIFCDDPAEGKFRLHLTVRGRIFLFWRVQRDSEELRKLLALVRAKIEAWAGPCEVRQIVL